MPNIRVSCSGGTDISFWCENCGDLCAKVVTLNERSLHIEAYCTKCKGVSSNFVMRNVAYINKSKQFDRNRAIKTKSRERRQW